MRIKRERTVNAVKYLSRKIKEQNRIQFSTTNGGVQFENFPFEATSRLKSKQNNYAKIHDRDAVTLHRESPSK